MAKKLGTTLKVKVKVAKHADRFAVNLGLHFNPCFSSPPSSATQGMAAGGRSFGKITCALAQGQRSRSLWPLRLTVAFERDGFKVTLPDGYQFTFPNRLGHSQLPYLSIEDGFSISSLSLSPFSLLTY
ncbi:galectin-2-like [Dasypus novemcinctus]|uniref:galectin-2-like n=1 Tax=Dasypus novemcinctus TaxID=9361 RepID=UPI00062A54D5|nr:galectin-2-like [Dasypus novemcinctus]